LASPSFAAAAGLVIVAGGLVWFWSGRASSPADIAEIKAPAVALPAAQTITAKPDVQPIVPAAETRPTARPKPELAVYRIVRPQITSPTSAEVPAKSVPADSTETAYMPGEDTYVRTISSLSKIVDTQKDTAMRPSQRVAYEHDMAVVDDAIAKMKKEVKKNPADRSARQVLYASYQNKIDLLKSVSQKEELMASLR
jgi:hypothetical protein